MMLDKAMEQQDPIGQLRVDKALPRITAFVAGMTRDDREVLDAVFQLGRLDEPAFLAWQTVRKGNRAGLVVGNIGCRGQVLPYTGFEGYFAHGELGPVEIVRQEALLGCQSLEALRHYLAATPPPGEHGPLGALAALRATLHGESYDRAILRLLNAYFGALLGRLRAQETMQAGWYDAFKDTTYASLRSPLTYSREQNVVCEHYELPLWADRGTLPSASVPLDEAQLEGYLFMAEIGRVGHPLLRGVLHHGL
jgi:hypothetical protein